MTTSPVRTERIGHVVALVLDAGPGNPLSPPVRVALMAALDALPPDARALVLLAEGAAFAAEGEGDAAAEPTAAALCHRLEALGIPVVAAVQGTAAGAGAALALAAHYRIAAEGAALHFPAVKLDLCPEDGATQRLPRLIGPAAVPALIHARPVAEGVFDRTVPRGQLAEAAVAFAAAAPPPRPTGARRDGFANPGAYRAALAAARAEAAASPLAAPRRILDCLEAALLFPLPQGLTFEAAVAEELAARPEAQARRAVAAAERRALAAARALPAPERVAVWGAEGADLARAAVTAGLDVALVEATEATLSLALEVVAQGLADAVAAGVLAAAAKEAAWARLTPALASAPPPGAGLHVLAGPWADMPPRLDAPAPTLRLGPPGPMQLGLLLPRRGRLAELAGEAPGAALAMAFLARIGRVPVATRGEGILAPMRAAVAAATATERARGTPEDRLAGTLARLGLGPGPASTDPATEFRLRLALANAGLRLLGSGTALRPSDIDLALVHGADWRRDAAGPMLWAADRGALVLRADLARLAPSAPDLYTPAPLLGQLIHDEVRIEALEG